MKILKDFVDCRNLQYSYKTFGGDAGAKVGVLLNGEDWIMKYPKNIRGLKRVNTSYSTSPISEYIGSHIYSMLGFQAQETLLGFTESKVVVLCKNFDPSGNRFHDFKSIRNYTSDIDKFTDGSSTRITDVFETIDTSPIIVCKEDTKKFFWDMFIVDALINNNDRNNTNWGFLYDSKKMKETWEYAPIFDCGNSFNNKLSDNDMFSRFGNPKKLVEVSCINCVSCFRDDDDKLIYPFRFMKEKSNTVLKNEINKIVPIILAKTDDIIGFIQEIPETTPNGLKVISPIHKEFITKTIVCRIANALVPLIEEQKSKNSDELEI